MFSNLSLFSQQSCPDFKCKRPYCVFGHGEAFDTVERPQNNQPTAPPAKRHRPLPVPLTSRAPLSSSPQQSAVASPLSTQERTSSASVVPSGHAKPSNVSASRIASASSGDVGPPSLPSLRFSPQPVSDRQKALRTLYTQFSKLVSHTEELADSLYSAVLPLRPELARESAIEQEQEISSSMGSVKAYKMAIHQAAVAVSRRQPPDRIPHVSIGTVKQCRAATEAASKAMASRLTPQRLERYRVSASTLADWGYPDLSDPSIQEQHTPDPPDTVRVCDRCKVEFVVTASNETGPCTHHYGRLAPEQQQGRRTWLYTCCGRERGAAGCEEGVHVFSLKEDDRKLAAFVPYRTTRQIVATQGVVPKATDVVGMDCEMIYTTAGLWLARVTVVDENGQTLLDEFVRQDHHVLDYNQRFSGVTEAQLAGAAMNLAEVREAVCTFISPDTYVVGHGLENDLRSLRLLHDRVIDTAILFPHPKGRPYRRALRDLVKENLGYFIQQLTSEKGHSSQEDAAAALELVKWKAREDET